MNATWRGLGINGVGTGRPVTDRDGVKGMSLGCPACGSGKDAQDHGEESLRGDLREMFSGLSVSKERTGMVKNQALGATEDF